MTYRDQSFKCFVIEQIILIFRFISEQLLFCNAFLRVFARCLGTTQLLIRNLLFTELRHQLSRSIWSLILNLSLYVKLKFLWWTILLLLSLVLKLLLQLSSLVQWRDFNRWHEIHRILFNFTNRRIYILVESHIIGCILRTFRFCVQVRWQYPHRAHHYMFGRKIAVLGKDLVIPRIMSKRHFERLLFIVIVDQSNGWEWCVFDAILLMIIIHWLFLSLLLINSHFWYTSS